MLYKGCPILPDNLIEKIKSIDNPYYGFNLTKNEFCEDLIEAGIADSFNTIKTAIEDAVSVASLIVTTECIVFKEHNYDRKFYFLII